MSEKKPPHNQEYNRQPLSRLGVRLLGAIGLRSALDRRRDNQNPVSEALQVQGFVRHAPDFASLWADNTRSNMITSGGAYKDVTSGLDVPAQELSVREDEALLQLHDFLQTAAEHSDIVGVESATIAGSMNESLAYIGEREFKEAGAGIAQYWKEQLQQQDDLQLLVCVGGQGSGFAQGGRSEKSDGYLLETVLGNFTDEELQQSAGRIVMDTDDISHNHRTKAVLLDDWSISGTQLRQARSNLKYYAEEIDEYEVCLVAASAAAIEHGLELHDGTTLPIRAYFQVDNPTVAADMGKANHYGDTYPGYLTGSHSSVDFNFDRIIATMVHQANSYKADGTTVPSILTTMPAGTQIERSYRQHQQAGFQSRIELLNKLNNKPYVNEQGQFIRPNTI